MIILDDDPTKTKRNDSKASSRTTLNRMTKYEFARIVGIRAIQLSEDAQPFVDIGNLTNCGHIAMRELLERKLPFIIRRFFPNGSYEDWPVGELLIPGFDF